jgi:hypothetical protein
MVATTPTWEIPYAEDTDPFCDGCTITQSMAERIDEILAEFDTSLSASSVIPLARASRLTQQSNLTSSGVGEVIYTAVDFDTTGIADLNQPTNPIYINGDDRFAMGGAMQWDSDATSGTEGISLGSAQGSPLMAFIYRQRVNPVVGDDMYGTFAGVGEVASIFSYDRISVQHGTFSNAYVTYVWAWRVGPA